MTAEVIRICDYDALREPDAHAGQRAPSRSAVIIILPVVRPEPPCDVSFDDGVVTVAVGEVRDVFGGPEVQVFERPSR